MEENLQMAKLAPALSHHVSRDFVVAINAYTRVHNIEAIATLLHGSIKAVAQPGTSFTFVMGELDYWITCAHHDMHACLHVSNACMMP